GRALHQRQRVQGESGDGGAVRRAALLMLAIGSLGSSPRVAVSADDPALEGSAGRLEIDGRPFDGVVRAWYAAGALREERSYRRGLEHGTHRGWWENGRERFQATYRDGALQGTLLEWGSEGHLYHSAHFVSGRESGRQLLWNADGTLRANYVVKDGRR